MANETVENVCKDAYDKINFGDGVFLDLDGRLAVKYGKRILAAHNREIAAKDAEIAKRDALVKELADALDCSVKEHAWIVECGDNVKVCEKCLSEKCVNKKSIDLIAKAREVCHV